MNLKSVLSDVKDAIRYLWSPLLMLWIAFSLLILASSCSIIEDEPTKNCGTFATIRDMRGLDACGFVFELDNGEKLEPIYDEGCHTAHSNAEYTVSGVEMLDGKKVTIAWKERPDRVSACMVGKIVEITCIEEVVEDSPRTHL